MRRKIDQFFIYAVPSLIFMSVFISSVEKCAYSQSQQKIPAPISYSKEIQPIFRTACTGCHNADSSAGGLNLASYVTAIKGGRGGSLLLPGKGADSRLMKYLTGALKPQMPPGGALKQSDIDHIRQWIDAGAKIDSPDTGIKRPLSSIKQTTSNDPIINHTTANSIVTQAGANFILRKPAPVTSLAFSRDGKTVAIGTYREVQFWNVETKQKTAVWRGHHDTIGALAYSKDGKMLAAGSGISGATGEVRIWDVVNGYELSVIGDHADTVHGVTFNPDGTKLATASGDKSIKVWDIATGKSIAIGRDHSDAVWSIDWSANGKYIASGGADRSIKIWDAQTLKRLYTLSGHEDTIYSLEFQGEGATLLSASGDRTARMWTIGAESGSVTGPQFSHGGGIYSASSGGKNAILATASADKTVKIWGLNGGTRLTLTDSKDWVYVVKFNPSAALVAAGTFDGNVFIWNVADGKLVTQFNTAFSPAKAQTLQSAGKTSTNRRAPL